MSTRPRFAHPLREAADSGRVGFSGPLAPVMRPITQRTLVLTVIGAGSLILATGLAGIYAISANGFDPRFPQANRILCASAIAVGIGFLLTLALNQATIRRIFPVLTVTTVLTMPLVVTAAIAFAGPQLGGTAAMTYVEAPLFAFFLCRLPWAIACCGLALGGFGLVLIVQDGWPIPLAQWVYAATVVLSTALTVGMIASRSEDHAIAEQTARADELQASRLRIVNASDSSRRDIERNLHDGAQQHLVALSVKIGLVRSIAEDGDLESVLPLLDSLREDVRVTIGQVRELAHGIYPPLLRDRGLPDALQAAASRSPLPCRVDVVLAGRYAQDVETAAYFCTLEAMQNAGKHAGSDATITVTVRSTDTTLEVEVADDGIGFDPARAGLSHGFVNMQDRLGALGGSVDVWSVVAEGTRITATIPAEPLDPPES